MTTTDKYLTLTEVATKLGVSERTIRRRIDNGDIEAEKFHGKLMVVADSITDIPELDTSINRDKSSLLKELQQTVSTLRQQVTALEEQVADKDAQLKEKDADLRRKDEQTAEAGQRHDTVVMQMTRLVEYHQQPFWKRWRRKELPGPANIAE